MRRAWPIQLLLCFVASSLAGFAWLTNHPDSEVLVEAEQLPFVGPIATRFREAYSSSAEPPERPAPKEIAASKEGSRSATAPRPAVDTSAFEARPFEWFRDGAAILESPDSSARKIGSVQGPRRLALFQEQGEWAAVRMGELRGWIRLDTESVLDEPALGRATRPVVALDGRAPAPDLLRTALESFPSKPMERQTGPYRTFTDLQDSSVLAFLDRVAEQLEGHYRERTALAPKGKPRAILLLFEQEASYRKFQQQEARLVGLTPRGHAGAGLAALFVGDSHELEVAATLVHELTHLLNRRAIGPALPPWLDEGIADDLGSSRIHLDGSLEIGSLRGEASLQGNLVSYTGAFAALRQLQERVAADTLPTSRTLVSLDWETFVGERNRRFHYNHAVFWTRFLLSSQPSLGSSFREFLQSVAQGGSVEPNSLEDQLQRSWPELDTEFRSWLHGEFIRWLPLIE